MFFAVKHIYLTLYIVYMCCNTPIYGVPLYLAPLRVRVCARVGVWPRGRARCAVHLLAYVLAALASVLYRLGNCYIFNDTSPGLFFTCARCACLCVCLLMPGQRWTF